MLILLPPSEGKEFGGSGRWNPGSGYFGRQFRATRSAVAEALATTPAKALKVQGATAAHALSVNQSLIGSPVRPARERYSGVVYQGLTVSGWDARERDAAAVSLVVVSGLLGAVAWNDPTPDYRAPMDASLPDVGSLRTLWQPLLTPALTRASEGEPILDLLANVHRGAVTPTGPAWWIIDLVHPTGVGGHAAKFAKGELARWLLTHSPTKLGTWRSGEWRARRREG